MKILLDIKDSKVSFVLELLNNFSFVKIQKINNTKVDILNNLSEAVEEMNQIKAGKKQARNAEEFINEL